MGKFDRGGRRRPIPDKDRVVTVEYDTVFAAVGQAPDLSFSSSLSIGRDTIGVDPRTMATDVPGLFAGGDAVTGPARVVDAIAAGRRAAGEIDKYLAAKRNGRPYVEPADDFGVTMKVPAETVERGRPAAPKLSPPKRIKGFLEVESGFDEKTARQECARCLRCDVKEIQA
ncbi:MAG: FAD-dependent oxidoreductase [Proteobacteria bacterium]|nr:FAD-dependent oxidoreductase [Pseudomonadota bacterium]